ncbi:MAG: ATP-binding region ATPase domain protein [Gemmatimonadetes bacterium]|nr:ATP-binding region ATPase domain protein [Gemmatimonadota bacterium]
MTLRSRLVASLATIVLVLVVPLVVALNAMHVMQRDARAFRDGELAASLLLGRLRDALGEVRQRETALLFVREPASRDAMHEQAARVLAITDSLKKLGLDGEADSIRASVQRVDATVDPEYSTATSGHGAAAESLSTQQMLPAIALAERNVSRAERTLSERTRARVLDADAALSDTRRISLAALALAMLGAAVIAWLLTRAINRPVVALADGMRAVAEGDLDHKLAIGASRSDEFGTLARGFEEMTRQLSELDKLKAEFVSVASHELKTPINVIMGYLALLEEGVYGPMPDKQLDVVRTLETQAASLGRLTKQLLDVSRFEAGGDKLDPRTMNLSEFLDELEAGFQVLAMQRSIRFMVSRDEELPATVQWDRDRISEVVGNLLSNAFKFTPRGGSVELCVHHGDDCVRMDVRDTGAGISPEQLPRIFEKFYQADNQKQAAAKGTGLGLAITRQLVEAHKGTITVESTPGEGTTFSISLPLASARRKSATMRAVTAGVA